MCHTRGEWPEMPSNYHNEANPSFNRLSYEYEWRYECQALSFTTNPKKFLNVDTFCFFESWVCSPPLSVGLIGWIYQVKVNIHSSKDGASMYQLVINFFFFKSRLFSLSSAIRLSSLLSPPYGIILMTWTAK